MNNADLRARLAAAEQKASEGEKELKAAMDRAHTGRLAFDWLVEEFAPAADAQDKEQLWQEAHAAMRKGEG